MFTEKDLLEIGFEQTFEEGDEYYTFEGVAIWNFNGEYWIVDMLDQYRVDRKFRTLEELNVFFKTIDKPLNIT